MVTTSKRKAAQIAATRLETQGQSTDEGGGSEYGGNTESEDGEHPVKRQRTTVGALSRPSKSAVKGKAREKGKAKGETALGLEELTFHELVKLLQKKDSVQTKLLLTGDNTELWRQARSKVVPSAPDPPPNVKELEWARVLLDENYCQSCEGQIATTFFPELCCRLCPACSKSKLQPASEFQNYYCRRSLYKMVPYIRVKTGTLFWRDETDRAFAKLIALRQDFPQQPIVKAYEKERQDFVDYVAQHSPIWKAWFEGLKQHQIDNKTQQKEDRLNSLRAKFVEIGYSQEDVQALTVSHPSIQRGKAQISSADWKKLQVKLEPVIVDGHRKRCLSAYYTSFKEGQLSSFTAETLRLYPSFRELCELESIQTLLEAMPKNYANRSLELPGEKTFANLVRTVITQTDENLRQQIGDSHPSASSNTDVAEVATYIFTCPCPALPPSSRYPLFGLKMAATHQCMDRPGRAAKKPRKLEASHDCPKLGLERRATEIASKVISSAGLSPHSATMDEMDRLNKRFYCLACIDQVEYKQKNRHLYDPRLKAFTWRTAIRHAMINHRKYYNEETQWKFNKLAFQVVDEPEKLELVFHQERSSELSTKIWFCNHCITYNKGDAQTEDNIKSHIVAEHEVDTPVISEDYFKSDELASLYTIPAMIQYFDPPPARSSYRGAGSSMTDYDDFDDNYDSEEYSESAVKGKAMEKGKAKSETAPALEELTFQELVKLLQKKGSVQAELLLATDNTGLWRQARSKAVPSAPDPPPNVKELEWATVLLDEKYCQVGKNMALEVTAVG
ncbi:hypothetical protein BKA70DRAFT_1554393 [Coprinopsis sp. MPI-PUGE-AT-0042]|nr:hypothetical protein BKA70DRAFT_1554393 [Coprinopsis sp. MPI-PUGE-AT-0042]